MFSSKDHDASFYPTNETDMKQPLASGQQMACVIWLKFKKNKIERLRFSLQCPKVTNWYSKRKGISVLELYIRWPTGSSGPIY